MSVLSGIGLQPPVFGGLGSNGGMVQQLDFGIPAVIDMIANPVGTIMPSQPVPNGEYLIQVLLSIECNDATTTTDLLTITMVSNGNGDVQNILYNSPPLASEFYSNVLFYANVTGGSLELNYVLQQTGNTGGYNILSTLQPNGSGGVTAWQLTYPILG